MNDSQKTVTQALSFQRPDRLPMHINAFWPEFAEIWRRVRNQPEEVDIKDYYGNDLSVAAAKEQLFPTRMRKIKQQGKDVFVNDGWGRVVRTRPGTYFQEPVERIFNKPADLDKLQFDPPDLDMRYESFLRNVANQRSKARAVFVKIGGIFMRSSFFRGETEFLMDLAGDEVFAKEIVERVGEHLLQIGLESLKRADAYDFGVWIYDDMCNANGPMFSPQVFERIFLPTYKRIISSLKAAGAKWVILHCDGNLGPLLDLIVEAGFDGINPVEYNAGLDVAKLMEQYYGRLSFIGGLCNINILPKGSPDEIRRHVEAIADAGRNGGLVIGTHSIGPDIPVENYEIFHKIATKNGRGQ